jgi:hypothetical protein
MMKIKFIISKYQKTIMNYPNFSYKQLGSLDSSLPVYTRVFLRVFEKKSTLHNIKRKNLVTIAFTTTKGAFTRDRLMV